MQSVERRLTRARIPRIPQKRRASHYGHKQYNQSGRTTTNSISSVRYMSVTAMLSCSSIYFNVPGFFRSVYAGFHQDGSLRAPGTDRCIFHGTGCGILICLIKNVLHLFITTTGGVGELQLPSGRSIRTSGRLIYRHKKRAASALIGSLFGAVIMGVFSVVSNYFLVYPDTTTLCRKKLCSALIR